MAKAFLLRFQEDCEPDDACGVTAGTMTMTKTHTEQPDDDVRQAAYTAINRAGAMQAGTITNTRVQNEQGDKDRSSDSHAIPRHPLEMGTKTATNVKAEADDNDPGRQQNQIVPRCC